jgi:hypothetical protein
LNPGLAFVWKCASTTGDSERAIWSSLTVALVRTLAYATVGVCRIVCIDVGMIAELLLDLGLEAVHFVTVRLAILLWLRLMDEGQLGFEHTDELGRP